THVHDDLIPFVGGFLGSGPRVVTGVAVDWPQPGSLAEQALLLGLRNVSLLLRGNPSLDPPDCESRKQDCHEYSLHDHDSAQNPTVNWLRNARSVGVVPAGVVVPSDATNSPPL